VTVDAVADPARLKRGRMSISLQMFLAFAIGATVIVLRLAMGQSASSETYVGAVIYLLAFTFGLPVLLAGIVWIMRGRSKRASAAVTTFLVTTAAIGVYAVIASLSRG
jgi:hypothetical protein